MDEYEITGRGICGFNNGEPVTAPLEWTASCERGILTLRVPSMLGVPEGFERTDEVLDDEAVLQILSVPLKDMIGGAWMLRSVVENYWDVFEDFYPAKVTITGMRMSVDMANDHYGIRESFSGPIIFMDGTRFALEGNFEMVWQNNTFLEEKYEMFYTIRSDGTKMYMRSFFNLYELKRVPQQ